MLHRRRTFLRRHSRPVPSRRHHRTGDGSSRRQRLRDGRCHREQRHRLLLPASRQRLETATVHGQCQVHLRRETASSAASSSTCFDGSTQSPERKPLGYTDDRGWVAIIPYMMPTRRVHCPYLISFPLPDSSSQLYTPQTPSTSSVERRPIPRPQWKLSIWPPVFGTRKPGCPERCRVTPPPSTAGRSGSVAVATSTTATSTPRLATGSQLDLKSQPMVNLQPKR